MWGAIVWGAIVLLPITAYKWSWYIHLPVYQTNDIRNIHIVHLVQLILTLDQSILKFLFFIVSSKQSRISYNCSSILFQSIYILIMWRKQVDIILNSDSIYRLKKKIDLKMRSISFLNFHLCFKDVFKRINNSVCNVCKFWDGGQKWMVRMFKLADHSVL